MPNKNYVNGRALEYQIMEEWREKGYEVIRASGSHGLYDVVAFRSDRPVEFIQAKRVEDESTANRLLKSFTDTTAPSKYFHQTIAVKIKGTKQPITRTI